MAAGPETLRTQHRRQLIEACWAVGGLGCPWWGQSDAAAVSGDEQAAMCGARVQSQVSWEAQERERTKVRRVSESEVG